MVPVHFDDNGWFTCGNDGTTEFEYEIDAALPQSPISDYSLSNIDRDLMLLHLRNYKPENYILDDTCYTLKGTETNLNTPGSPTFIGIRQQTMKGSLSCKISVSGTGEAGFTGVLLGMYAQGDITANYTNYLLKQE